MKVAVILTCLLFPAVSYTQTTEPMRFLERFGFDEGEVAERVMVLDRGSKLVLVGRKNIQMWNPLTPKLLSSIPHEIKRRKNETFQASPDGRILIGARDRFVPLNLKRDATPEPALVYDLASGKQIATLQRPKTPIRSVQWSHNGQTIVSFSNQLQKEVEISFWRGDDFAWRASFTVTG